MLAPRLFQLNLRKLSDLFPPEHANQPWSTLYPCQPTAMGVSDMSDMSAGASLLARGIIWFAASFSEDYSFGSFLTCKWQAGWHSTIPRHLKRSRPLEKKDHDFQTKNWRLVSIPYRSISVHEQDWLEYYIDPIRFQAREHRTLFVARSCKVFHTPSLERRVISDPFIDLDLSCCCSCLAWLEMNVAIERAKKH